MANLISNTFHNKNYRIYLFLKFSKLCFMFFLFDLLILLWCFHVSQPLKCQGLWVKHMQHTSQFITLHLPDNFSPLTSLGKSYSLCHNVWALMPAWWVKSVAIGCYSCGVLVPIRPIRLVCIVTRLELPQEQVKVQVFIEDVCKWPSAMLDC